MCDLSTGYYRVVLTFAKNNSEVLKAPGYLHVPGSTCTRNSKLPSLCLSRKNCKSSCFENRRGESKGTTIASVTQLRYCCAANRWTPCVVDQDVPHQSHHFKGSSDNNRSLSLRTQKGMRQSFLRTDS
jgi:hypothetical protein